MIVSGANRGLGRHIALEFARQGHRVFAGCRRPADATALRRAADGGGLTVHIGPMDVRSTESVEAFVADVQASAGAVDAVVCNAGVFATGPVEEVDDDEALAMLDTNTLGALRLIRAVLPGMRAQRDGVILAVASLSGRVPAPGSGIYAASKLALIGLLEALVLEVEGFGIRVACLEPGPYRTEMAAPASGPTTGESPYAELMDAVRARTARRMAASGDPAEVARAAVAAALDASTPLHVPVGRHAEEALGGSPDRSTMWIDTIRGDLRGSAGARSAAATESSTGTGRAV